MEQFTYYFNHSCIQPEAPAPVRTEANQTVKPTRLLKQAYPESVQLLIAALEQRGHRLISFYDEFLIDVYVLLDKLSSKQIAIDWDNTLSEDEAFFIELIERFQLAGYSPFICSLRAPDLENLREIKPILDLMQIPIYLTDGREKRKFLKKLGIRVNLWIDDYYPAICRTHCKLLSRNRIG